MFAFRIIILTLSSLLPALVNAATPVSLAKVEMQQPVRELMINGTLSADQSARLSAAVAGLVSRVRVDIGDVVDTGDVLLELDPELNRLALQQAQATRRQQQSALNDAQRRLEEASSLIARRSIAASEVRSLESEVEAAKAALAASHADVGRQQALLERHTLNAPFAGVISAKLTEAGEWVSPGMAVFELVGSTDLHADFAVPQRYFSQLSLATPLTIRVENSPTNTIVCGLAPLVLIPGEGTELYRGVGAIVLFGLLGSAIVTVTFLAALTALVLRTSQKASVAT